MIIDLVGNRRARRHSVVPLLIACLLASAAGQAASQTLAAGKSLDWSNAAGLADAAVVLVRQSWELDKERLYARGLGYLHYNNDMAIKYFTLAIELDPRYEAAYFDRGIAYFNLGRIADAAYDYEKTIELNPKNQRAYVYRGDTRLAKEYPDKNDFDGAMADFETAIQLDPKDPWAFHFRANAKVRRKDFDGAFADYAKAIELDPKSDLSYLYRGFLRYDLRSWSEALADFRKAAELAPDLDSPRQWIWLTRARLGQQEAATAELIKYMQEPGIDQKGSWSSKLNTFLTTDQISPKELEDAANNVRPGDGRTQAVQLTEARFFTGNKLLLAGDKEGAISFLKICFFAGPALSHYPTRALADLKALGWR